MGRLAAQEIRRLDLPLARYLKPEVRFEGAGKTVLLDNFYNSEWRKDTAGARTRYHYVWHDTTNSGYSQLGALLTGAGAVIDTLCQAPTPVSLARGSLYIIVDPDTPQETERPEYISAEAAGAIEAWVRQGGILVLLGNDNGNAEFEHFNALAARFGIRFNEDSRNRVVGKAFEVGTFDRFPDHPVFRGVRRVYIKELSTLSLQPPAEALFSQEGDTILAFARHGKGAVFAAGDPWFYNEYMDGPKLPPGYDNPKAADNLFRWLLGMSGGAGEVSLGQRR
jgi:unsaturated rhamnogalacturonyl hydrolase